jgi:hypothetical protein
MAAKRPPPRPPPRPLPRPPPPPRFDPPWERETLRPEERRDSVRTLFAVRARVGMVWALISLALGAGAYILGRALFG